MIFCAPILLALILPAPSQAEPLFAVSTISLTVPFIISRFEEVDQRLHSLSAQFSQIVRVDQSASTQSVTGSIDFQRPDFLHIVHRGPEQQTIVSDGTTLWIWRRDSNQVIQADLKEWRQSDPLAQGLLNFGGYAQLLKRYQVNITSISMPDKDGYRRFELLLRPRQMSSAPDFVLKLHVDTHDFIPYETELETGGISVRSSLDHIRFNPNLEPTLFHFTPPAGADIFKNFHFPRTN